MGRLQLSYLAVMKRNTSYQAIRGDKGARVPIPDAGLEVNFAATWLAAGGDGCLVEVMPVRKVFDCHYEFITTQMSLGWRGLLSVQSAQCSKSINFARLKLLIINYREIRLAVRECEGTER